MLRVISLLMLLVLAVPLWAAESAWVERTSARAQLITAEDGIAPGARTLSAGLRVEMTPGWKTYWRSPGEVGLPPEILWDGSRNLAEAELLFPAPERFTAFEIENFGYGGTVVFPIQISLEAPGEPVTLNASVRLLVCADVCIPEDFTLSLELAAGAGINPDHAATLAEAIAEVPLSGEDAGMTDVRAHWDERQLTLEARRDVPFIAPDVFPELGDASFGKPDIRLSDGGSTLWASLPVLYLPDGAAALDLTITDGAWAVTAAAAQANAPLPAPVGTGLLMTALIAILGGLILNVMPCVLPVLSLKIGHALETATQGPARVRAGFLASALGIVSFMWLLAAIVLSLQGMGRMVGWGIQFQSPVFLSLMILLMVLFAANMAGLFEINLPDGLQTRMGGPQGAGLLGDYATGAFAAVMATPCSAPFLGTAVAFALAGGALDVVVIFTALGLGLALPYLLFALLPGLITALPRPGAWMVKVKWGLGALLGLTALWLLSILWASAGLRAALVMAAIAAAILALMILRLPKRGMVLSALSVAALALPAALAAPAQLVSDTNWAVFDQARIAEEVADGRVVFVDVTADWCLTCKANKALVLDREPVASLFEDENLLPMQADWTRPDATIQSYLQSYGRFGIPFNVVYGPAAPQGIPLPELLTAQSVTDAIDAAR